MKRFLLSLVLLATVAFTYAQRPVVIPLYPAGTPQENGLEGKEATEQGYIAHVSEPELHVYLPEEGRSNGMAVIICPGGSYEVLAMEHEGAAWAGWLNDQGIAAIVYKYRMPNGNHEIPTIDIKRAINLVRELAHGWSVDPGMVGVMGFSAGGHLASTAATHFTGYQDRPNFAILMYPVISMGGQLTHHWSRYQLLGIEPDSKITDWEDKQLIGRYSNELRVTVKTPAVFIAYSADDDVVNPRNVTVFFNSLHRHAVPAELHVWPKGGHGWGFNESFPYKDELRASLSRWLREQRERLSALG